MAEDDGSESNEAVEILDTPNRKHIIRNSKIMKARKALNGTESFIAQLVTQQELVISKLLKAKDENERLLDEYEEMHTADILQQNMQISRLQEKLTSLTKTNKSLQEELEKLRSKNRILKAKHPKLLDRDEETELLKQENDDLLRQLEELRTLFEAKTHEFATIRKRLNNRIKVLQGGESENPDSVQPENGNEVIDGALYIVKAQELQTKLQYAKRDNQRLIYENAKLKAQLEQGKSQELLHQVDFQGDQSIVAYLRDERIIRQEQISNLEATLLEQKFTEDTLKGEHREKEKRVENLTDQVQELQNKLALKEREIAALKKEVHRGTLKMERKEGVLSLFQCTPTDITGTDETLKLYLKRSLLQFFMQDEAKRTGLVPVILEIAGCSESEIQVAQRLWQKRNSFY